MYVWALLLGFVSEKDKTHTPVQEAIAGCSSVSCCRTARRRRVAFLALLLCAMRFGPTVAETSLRQEVSIHQPMSFPHVRHIS
jgi:hypothetical protein